MIFDTIGSARQQSARDMDEEPQLLKELYEDLQSLNYGLKEELERISESYTDSELDSAVNYIDESIRGYAMKILSAIEAAIADYESNGAANTDSYRKKYQQALEDWQKPICISHSVPRAPGSPQASTQPMEQE